jgi:hypothetical protein
MKKKARQQFALCVNSAEYKASLIAGKVYRILREPKAAKDDLLRIVDESGEDYLYHKSLFVVIDLPKALTKKLIAIEKAA